MLDKTNVKFLTKLNKLCAGTYKVFEKPELAGELGIKQEVLDNTLKFFQERQYIDIKYADENVVCLTVLPKAFGEIEIKEGGDFTQKKLVKFMLFNCLFSAVSAFIGAFIAMFIIG